MISQDVKRTENFISTNKGIRTWYVYRYESKKSKMDNKMGLTKGGNTSDND